MFIYFIPTFLGSLNYRNYHVGEQAKYIDIKMFVVPKYIQNSIYRYKDIHGAFTRTKTARPRCPLVWRGHAGAGTLPLRSTAQPWKEQGGRDSRKQEEVRLKGWVEKASFKRRDSMAHFKVQTCECTYKYTHETGASKKPGASHLKWRWEVFTRSFCFLFHVRWRSWYF